VPDGIAAKRRENDEYRGSNFSGTPPPSRSARHLPHRWGRLKISGEAAVGILTTLHNKRAIASTVGSLPRRELSTGLRDGDGFGPQA
jgi:hypothetical protein